MANGFKVDTNGLVKAAKNIQSVSVDYGKSYAKMVESVNSLTKKGAGWTGTDATAFKNDFEKLRETFDKVKKFIEVTGHSITAAKDAYEKTQEHNRGMFAK